MKQMISDRIKIARKDAGYGNAREAAEALHVEYPTYAAHENGSRKPDLETAAFYCRKFKVTLDWLVGLSDQSETDDAPSVETTEDAPSTEANILRLWDLFNRVRRAKAETQVRVIGLLEDVLPKRGVSQTHERQERSGSRD